jgi:hypothetical protein
MTSTKMDGCGRYLVFLHRDVAPRPGIVQFVWTMASAPLLRWLSPDRGPWADRRWHNCRPSRRDGAIAWRCVPRFDAPPLFHSIIDARRGARFAITPGNGPDQQAEAARRELIRSVVVLEGTVDLNVILRFAEGTKVHKSGDGFEISPCAAARQVLDCFQNRSIRRPEPSLEIFRGAKSCRSDFRWR